MSLFTIRFEVPPIDIRLHYPNQSSGVGELKALLVQLAADLLTTKETIMATLDEVLADVTDEKTAIASIATLIAGLKQQIADALSGVTLPPAVQAKVDAVFAAAEQNKADIAAALASGVPPAS